MPNRHPTLSPPEQQRHYALVAQAIEYLITHARQQPSLSELAAAVHLSEYHLQRLFTAWAGISPKRFLQYLNKEHALAALRRSENVLNATLSTGLSSPGRLHDLMVSCEAMTPGEIRALGRDLRIGYGIAPSWFGPALIGWTARGICHLAFCDEADGADLAACLHELQAHWPSASFQRDDHLAADYAGQIFADQPQQGRLHLVLKGTNFQLKVWEALLSTRPAELLSYTQIATLAGSPRAQRAVGSALAANRIGYLVPCHRVIRESGEVGQFRWGNTRKRILQAWEAAQQTVGAQQN